MKDFYADESILGEPNFKTTLDLFHNYIVYLLFVINFFVNKYSLHTEPLDFFIAQIDQIMKNHYAQLHVNLTYHLPLNSEVFEKLKAIRPRIACSRPLLYAYYRIVTNLLDTAEQSKQYDPFNCIARLLSADDSESLIDMSFNEYLAQTIFFAKQALRERRIYFLEQAINHLESIIKPPPKQAEIEPKMAGIKRKSPEFFAAVETGELSKSPKNNVHECDQELLSPKQ